MLPPPIIPLDLLFYADQGVDLTGDSVRRVRAVKGSAFLEQEDAEDQPVLALSGMQPVLRFKGRQHLKFRGFGWQKGPHSFFIVCRTKSGLLLDVQANEIQIPAKRAHWQVLEVIQDSELPINEATLGAIYHGRANHLKGDIAAFGYKNGILQRGQREYVHKLLGQKLGEAEKGFWSFHIPKPRFFR